MPITTNPLNPNARISVSGTRLLQASRLQLPSQVSPQAVPIPAASEKYSAEKVSSEKVHGEKASHTEKVSLRSSARQLSDAELAEVSSLKARDSKVRQHEQAHLAASAGLNVSKAAFTYQRGPDGVNYAVGGDVRIDTSPGRTAQDSLARADMIVDVALAPADPTPSDRSAAAKAQNMAQQANAELLQQSRQIDAAKHAGHQHAVSQAYDDSSPARKNIDTFA